MPKTEHADNDDRMQTRLKLVYRGRLTDELLLQTWPEKTKNEEVMRSNLHQRAGHFYSYFGLPPGIEPRNSKQYNYKNTPCQPR
jgi:hypothetical protein